MHVSIWHVLAIMPLALLASCSRSDAKLVKPAIADVKGIRARLYSPHDIDLFSAKKESFAALLSILDDPTPDPDPAAWEVLGALFVELKNGKTMEIHLYLTGEGRPGAYSWQRSKNSRPYYRGSSDGKIISTIEQAYQSTQKETERAESAPRD